MFRVLWTSSALLLLLSAGALQAGDDAAFRLTILIEMNWDEGDMYRTYFGTADLYLQLSDGSDSAYVEYVESYMNDHPGEQVPDFLGTAEGLGELTIEGFGSSGAVGNDERDMDRSYP